MDSDGPIDEVADATVNAVTLRPNTSAAHDVVGTSQVRIGSDWIKARWICFTQVDGGNRYSALTSWTR